VSTSEDLFGYIVGSSTMTLPGEDV